MAVALSYAVVASLLVLLEVPSPHLFAGAIAGCGCALLVPSARAMPERLRSVGLAIIGVAAGSHINRGGCACVGLLMAEALGMSWLDGYLATTPGGLSAVTAMAVGTGANVGFVVAVQSLRVVIVLLLVAAIGAFVTRRRDKRGE